jgi:hypothetical protein
MSERSGEPMTRGICVFCFVILTLSFVNGVAAPDNVRRDGNWWITLDRENKAAYIIGFFDGMELGHNFSYWGMSEKENTNCAGAVSSSYFNYYKKYFSNITNLQVADGLDAFYSDYRNRRIKIMGATWIVVNGIAGTPQEDVDKMTESWRKNAGTD